MLTNDPNGVFAASGLLRLGRTRHGEALLNQPLGEDLALRAAMALQQAGVASLRD